MNGTSGLNWRHSFLILPLELHRLFYSLICIYKVLHGEWTTDVSTLHCYFQTLWYEVGRQHVKAPQAAAISPYLTSPTPPIHSQRTATTPGTSCPIKYPSLVLRGDVIDPVRILDRLLEVTSVVRVPRNYWFCVGGKWKHENLATNEFTTKQDYRLEEILQSWRFARYIFVISSSTERVTNAD